ncbi:MAG: monovalent cation/H+ antiporter subunit D [Gammaproteobacteria bacterium]|nr:monovalent cation/H+ antiporter subunit D [Gammaproteobacteria bacterium]MCF6229877.1 monovalent cation/H+ antiporter subunit D [Gammaproteobacteria bacterium]
MSHWLIMPVLLPMVAAILMLLTTRLGRTVERTISLLSMLGLVLISAALLNTTLEGDYQVYAVGNWVAPFGIVLVLDRLSALMVLLTSVLALFSLLYACNGQDREGRHFHVLFHMQLMGLNGAFLTGDLFNLFVFFEILLIASYGLLLHGGGPLRSRAGLHYVILNLAGSALFLVAIGVLYGMLGTLNMADLAVKVAQAEPEQLRLIHISALLLMVVFGLKAALLPLYFWLPSAYSAASPAVAALFAIMTKVGIYSIIRMFMLVFGIEAGVLSHLAQPWLLPLGLVTLALGAFGVLASSCLRRQVAYLVVVSVGTLMAGVGLLTVESLAASLYYLLHSTLITGGMFLLADVIARQRGDVGSQLRLGPTVTQPLLLSTLFFIGALAVVGLPPLSGFIGKLLLLQAAVNEPGMAWFWSVILIASFFALIALSRTGSALFLKTDDQAITGVRVESVSLIAVVALLLASPLLALYGDAVSSFTTDAAEQLMQPMYYIEGVLGSQQLPAAAAEVVQ